MKFSINSKWKIWVILTVAVLVVGFVLFGIFGFNQTVDYKTSHEAVITMDTQHEIAPEKLKEISETYFTAKNIEFVDYATESIDGPTGKYSVIYKFTKDVALDTEEMQEYITTVVNSEYIVFSVEYNDAVMPYYSNGIGWIVLALGIASVVAFVYLFFVEKLASAVSVICSAVLSAILFVALLGATRIPAMPFATALCAVSFALATFLSAGLVNRFKEEIKLNESKHLSSEKMTYTQIADKAAMSSLLRYSFVFIGLLLVSVVFIAAGAAYVKFLGLQLLVASVSAVFASLVGVPLLWPVLKNCKKK